MHLLRVKDAWQVALMKIMQNVATKTNLSAIILIII